MFELDWGKLVIIGIVALIAIGPKELPTVLRTLGQWVGKIRRMASEFQGQFQEALREAEMADLKKSFDEVREAASGFTAGNLMTSLEKDVSKSLDIDVLDKPAPSAADTPAVEPAATPATSKIDAPEAPVPETSTGAEAHAATSQPLAIVQEAQAQPAPQDTAPAAPDVLKDAKAS